MHKCKYFLAHCIDFRLGKAIKEYLEKNGLLGDCDEVSIAGAAKNSSFLLEQLDISISKHHSEEAILMNHLDCGAYGGSEAFSSKEEEREFHLKEMENAKKMILAKYPSLKVRMVLAVIQESGDAVFEEV